MASRLGSLVPPMLKLQAIGVNSSATRMNRVVDFYSKLPKGALPKKSAGVNPIARYRQAYFEGPEASAAPIGHLIVVLFLVGYTIDYNMHLKFHKNGHH